MMNWHKISSSYHGQAATPSFWLCLQDKSEGLEEAEGLDLAFRRLNLLKAADCALASLNLFTTVSTEVPKNTECEIGASKRKDFLTDLATTSVSP